MCVIQWEKKGQHFYCLSCEIISGREPFLLASFPAFYSRSVFTVSNGRWILGWWPWGATSTQRPGLASLLHSPEWRKSGTLFSQGVRGRVASRHRRRYIEKEALAARYPDAAHGRQLTGRAAAIVATVRSGSGCSVSIAPFAFHTFLWLLHKCMVNCLKV